MPQYCLQASYTTEAWSRVLENPLNSFEAVRVPIERLGGTLQATFFALDSFSVLAITEFPRPISAADISVALFASSAIAQVHFIPLLSASQAVEALRNSGTRNYRSSPDPLTLAAAT